MKKPTTLLRRVLLDVKLQSIDTIELDYREICNRYEHEGMSFLTITLPTLDDALVKGLAEGRLSPTLFPGFRLDRRRGSLPALLQGFFKRVFDKDGSLLPSPDVDAIFAIRQVTRLFKKVELPCSSKRISAAYERYVNNDKTTTWNMHRSDGDANLFTSITGYLWSDLERLSGELYCNPGQFGSGATAGREKRNERFSIRKWPERANSSFPVDFHALSRLDSSDIEEIELIREDREEPVRVVQVPKTLKTPRTISVEPSYMMLMQQSVAKPLMRYLESDFDFKSIRFTNQSVNRDLARLGSIDGSLATIDLSDASDLISNDLVKEIFKKVCPTFLSLIQDCRTRTAELPGGDRIHLNKFSSMGSAMCFPIEAMVFFTIVMFALCKHGGVSPSRRSLYRLSKNVAIYGDDIIVDSKMAPVVMEELEAFGLRVNHSKSFNTGLFRESCGGDYYAGVDITPTYVRHWDFTGTYKDALSLSKMISLSNNFYNRGMWNSSQSIRDAVDQSGRRKIPLSSQPIGCLHYVSFFQSDCLSWDARMHRYRVRGLHLRNLRQQDEPGSVSGFLLLAFNHRDFDGRCEEGSLVSRSGWVSSNQRCPDIPRVRDHSSSGQLFGSVDDRSLVLEGHNPSAAEAECAEYPTDFDPGGYLGHLRYSRLKSVQDLLDPEQARSSLTSERPYSLCLKSRWTASPAGLTW